MSEQRGIDWQEREHRVSQANKVILAIASVGRRFFSLSADKRLPPNVTDRVSYFQFNQGRLWFVDKWTEKRIYVGYKGRWRHFSEGGTLRALVERMGRWILQKGDFPLSDFGPFPAWVCGGDLWGYGADMEALRQRVQEIVQP